MLLLFRKVGEKIAIGDDITVTLVLIDRNKVRIGIEAPQEKFILRKELIGPARERQRERRVRARKPKPDPPSPPAGMTGFEIEDLCDLED